MRNLVLLCVGMSIGMLLITESSAAGSLGGSGQPAPTQSSEKKATPDNNAEVPGADIDWALQDKIDRVAKLASAMGANDPAYTGCVVDVQNARLQIYRKSATTSNFDTQKYLALARPGVSITFEPAPLSAKETEGLDRLIIALAPEFQAAGIQISGWGTDYAGGVRISYLPAGAEVPQHLRDQLEIYGPGTVSFQVGATVSLADFTADSVRQSIRPVD